MSDTIPPLKFILFRSKSKLKKKKKKETLAIQAREQSGGLHRHGAARHTDLDLDVFFWKKETPILLK